VLPSARLRPSASARVTTIVDPAQGQVSRCRARAQCRKSPERSSEGVVRGIRSRYSFTPFAHVVRGPFTIRRYTAINHHSSNMSETHLKLKDPAIMRVLRDIPTMQRWEVLRRAKRRFTVAELAAATGASAEATQQSLDALVVARLVDVEPATSRRRQITYRSAMERLFLHWSRSDPEDAAAWRTLGTFMRNYSRKVIDETAERAGSEHFAPHSFGGSVSVLLLDEDALRVRDSFRAAYAMLADADQRARGCPDPTAAKPYHVSCNQQRLWEAGPPMAELFVFEDSFHDQERKLLESGPSKLLSPRERDIARLLGRGMSRPQIAAQLGLTPNTVASISKIVYRKLGINSRAQLAERMRII
jgi:DNA-binding CsgD family transcriptional regulator